MNINICFIYSKISFLIEVATTPMCIKLSEKLIVSTRGGQGGKTFGANGKTACELNIFLARVFSGQFEVRSCASTTLELQRGIEF